MSKKYNFIQLQKITLRGFSLFKKNGKNHEVEEFIKDGVYCLAGANGLGKTTFLNAINYCLTGIVLEPGNEVYSPGEIVKFNKRYTERYFNGRIREKDKDNSEIEILFKVNEKYFRIIRGFFELDCLRLLEIYTMNNEKKIPITNKESQGPKELNISYQRYLSNEIGFDDFDYFIFYQLYILTFDENRRMIFWDDRASSIAMAIAFNADPKDTNRVIELKRRMEKHESDGRNKRWQATQFKNKINEILPKAKNRKQADIYKLEAEFNELYKNSEKVERVFNNVKSEYDTLLKKQSHLNSEILQLKTEQTRLFSRYSKPRSVLLENQSIRLSLKDHACTICGSSGTRVKENIEKNIYGDKCPLCSTVINEKNSIEQDKLLKIIEKNDSKILDKNTELEILINEIEGKNIELEKFEYQLNKILEEINEFNEDHPDISAKKNGKETIGSLLVQYKNQYELLDKESKEAYKKRDSLSTEYEELLKKVEGAYKEAEIDFVPIFKKLAKSFIGLDLNIKSDRSTKTIKLVVELQGTARTELFQLSESQRFFLDIALRMALSIFLSNKMHEAVMLVDTPEGSLDIAYESRVGNMFAEFVTTYNQNLFITANINASQLLISLAERCGNRKMKFRRMLDWVDPNPIQKEGEHLFEKVFKNIEIALRKSKT